MGVANFSNSVDIYKARYERMNRLNPPEYAPGQNPDEKVSNTLSANELFSGGGKIFDSSSQEVDMDDMSDIFDKVDNPFGNPFGSASSNPFGMSSSQMGMNNPMGFSGFGTGNTFGPSPNGMIQPKYQQGQGFTYEMAEELMVKGVKGLKKLFVYWSKTTPLYWYKRLGRAVIVGLALIGISAIRLVMGGSPFNMFMLGLVLTIFPLGTSLLLSDTVKKYNSEFKEEPTKEITSEYISTNNSNFNVNKNIGMNQIPKSIPVPIEDIKLDEYDEPDESSDDDDDDFDLDDLQIEQPTVFKENPEDVVNNMQEIPQGMYTRKYLYDMFTRLLPNICPDFSTLVEIDSEQKAFYEMESAVKEAAEVAGCKENIELMALRENYATIIVTTSRPQGLKLEATAEELARIYAYRSTDITEEGRSRVYAKVEAVGRTCIFTIFTGKTEMISLKDMYKQVEKYVLDSSNYMPVVFGIDPMAKVIAYDMKNLESIIIAGMPRSGKSWMAQNMITQMAAFTSPKELQFYICDPKGRISDFRPFCLPHVKKFVETDEDIMETLRYLVKKEAPRRKKIIGAGDVLTSSQNIWDYKKRYPDVELPLIYVVVDEVVTLASRMDKETFSEFRAILRELISQLPALGIRAILIPHVLKNDIIEKKTSDLVLCRVSVCGNAEHIESVTGAKQKDFPFQLSMPGDTAVRMPPVSQSIMYLRTPVLNATSPENRELFDYMRRVWSKLEPDTVNDSVAKNVETDRTVVATLNDTDIDKLDIFDANEEDYDDDTKTFVRRMNS